VFQFYVMSGLPLSSRGVSSSVFSGSSPVFPVQDKTCARMSHGYLRKLLLASDEFMQLLEDCYIGMRER